MFPDKSPREQGSALSLGFWSPRDRSGLASVDLGPLIEPKTVHFVQEIYLLGTAGLIFDEQDLSFLVEAVDEPRIDTYIYIRMKRNMNP